MMNEQEVERIEAALGSLGVASETDEGRKLTLAERIEAALTDLDDTQDKLSTAMAALSHVERWGTEGASRDDLLEYVATQRKAIHAQE